jgi:Rod binding domain-containing protein
MADAAMGGALDLTSQVASVNRLNSSLPRLGATDDTAAARKSATDFASFFLSQALESMYANVSTDSLFGGGNGEQVYRSLLLQEYGKVAAQSGSGTVIVDAVQRQILQLQEHARNAAQLQAQEVPQ